MKARQWLNTAGLWLAFTALLLVGVIFGEVHRRHPMPPRPRLLAAFLDVGAGDCTVFRTPDGLTILVDTGPAASARLVAETLRRQGIRTLDLLVLASPSEESIGGVPALIGSGFIVKQAWEGATVEMGPARQAALHAVRQAHIPLRTVAGGVQYPFKGGQLLALWPPAQETPARKNALICRLDYGASRIVLAGPEDAATEQYLVADAGSTLNCDVLQVTAGGTDNATSAEMLRRATPSVAVISCAASIRPGPGTLHRLRAAGAAVWRTDTQGAVTVFSDGIGSPLVTAAHL